MTFPLTGLLPAGAGVLSLVFVSTASSAAGGTTVSFSSQSLGTASDDRYIVVGFGSANGTQALNTATVGGVAASIACQVSGTSTRAGVMIANCTAGTTGTVSLTFAGSNSRVCISVYAVTGGLLSTTATSTATAANGNLASAVTLASISDGGFAVGMAANVTNGNSVTWSGLVRDMQGQAGDNGWVSSASSSFLSLQTNYVVTATFGSDNRNALAVGAWA